MSAPSVAAWCSTPPLPRTPASWSTSMSAFARRCARDVAVASWASRARRSASAVARTLWVPPSRDRPSAARAHGAQDPRPGAPASRPPGQSVGRPREHAVPGSSALPALRRGLPGPRATRPPPHLLALQRPRCRRLSARRTRRGNGDRRDSGPRVGREVALPRSLGGSLMQASAGSCKTATVFLTNTSRDP